MNIQFSARPVQPRTYFTAQQSSPRQQAEALAKVLTPEQKQDFYNQIQLLRQLAQYSPTDLSTQEYQAYLEFIDGFSEEQKSKLYQLIANPEASPEIGQELINVIAQAS